MNSTFVSILYSLYIKLKKKINLTEYLIAVLYKYNRYFKINNYNYNGHDDMI